MADKAAGQVASANAQPADTNAATTNNSEAEATSAAAAAAPAASGSAAATHATASSAAAPAPAPPTPVLQTCVSALGPVPVVDSSAALASLAVQLHSLTAPLPTAASAAQLTALEDTIQSQLESLDEFSALVESLKHGATQSSEDVLPRVIARQKALEPLISQIDAFDAYTRALELQLATVESRVAAVDSMLRRTDALEAEYARPLPSGASLAAKKMMASTEASAKKLFAAMINMGKSGAAAATSPTASAAAASSSSSSSSVSDSSSSAAAALDEWVPMDAHTPFVELESFFGQTPAPASAGSKAQA